MCSVAAGCSAIFYFRLGLPAPAVLVDAVTNKQPQLDSALANSIARLCSAKQVLTAKRGRGGLSRKPSLTSAAAQDFEDFSDSRWKVCPSFIVMMLSCDSILSVQPGGPPQHCVTVMTSTERVDRHNL